MFCSLWKRTVWKHKGTWQKAHTSHFCIPFVQDDLETKELKKKQWKRDYYHSRMHWRWNSCLQLVSCKREDRWNNNKKTANPKLQNKTKKTKNKKGIIFTYSRRIAVAEGFETDATSIITSLLYSPFHERCCRYQIPFRRRRISNSLENKIEQYD